MCEELCVTAEILLPEGRLLWRNDSLQLTVSQCDLLVVLMEVVPFMGILSKVWVTILIEILSALLPMLECDIALPIWSVPTLCLWIIKLWSGIYCFVSFLNKAWSKVKMITSNVPYIMREPRKHHIGAVTRILYFEESKEISLPQVTVSNGY